MLCLNSKYRKTKKCAKLDADGYAHHAYTTAKGPRFVPPDRRDVTLGVLSRLTVALDKAGKAKALPRGLPIYLTEFGIQSRPDRIQGVSFAKQAAYLSIAEHMAYVNPRVRSFSQYLMADDAKRASELNPYAGFESGLRTNKGKKKPAYKAFRLPLAVETYGAVRRAVGPRAPEPRQDEGHDRDRPAGQEEAAQARARSARPAPACSRCASRTRRAGSTACEWTSPTGKTYAGAWVRAY